MKISGQTVVDRLVEQLVSQPAVETIAPYPERSAGALRTLTTPRAGLLPATTIKDQITAGLS